MSTQPRKRSLLERIAALEKVDQRPKNPANTCALKQSNCSCKGKGFSLKVDTAYLKAELCKCVRSCAGCYGQARQIMQGAAKTCREPSPLRVVNIYNDAKISSLYLKATLSGFSNFSGNGREKLKQIQGWLGKFKSQGGPGLVLSGPVGLGKTYLLVAIAKHLIERGEQVRFIDFHRLLSVIRSAYADKKSEEEILAPLINAQVLIIDELGKGRNSDWEQEKLDQIVIGRYNQNKVLIASTNYSLKNEVNIQQSIYNVDLEQGGGGPRGGFNPDHFESLEARIGKRIFSRLFETSVLLDMTGGDFRKSNRRVEPRSGEIQQ